MFQSKIQNFNSSLKKKNVYNRLFSDSVKKKKLLNDLQLKHLAAEGKKYTFIPKINHNYKIIEKNDINHQSYKTPLTKKNLLRLKNIQKKNEVNNTYIYTGNINELNKSNIYHDNLIWNTISDIGTYYNTYKSIDIYKKNNNNINNSIKNKLLMPRRTLKNVRNSSSNKSKNNDFTNIIIDNLIHPFNINDKPNQINLRRTIKNKNNNLYIKKSDINKSKKHRYNTSIIKDENKLSNNLYNSSNIKKNSYIEFPFVSTSTTDTKSKNSVINSNNKKATITTNKKKNKYSNHSLSFSGICMTDNGPNMNINTTKKEKVNKISVNDFKNKKEFEITRNVSDCFSYLFNNYLNNKKNVPIGIKSIEIKKINDNKNSKITQINSCKNSKSNIVNSYKQNYLDIQENNCFNSIEYENIYNNYIDNKYKLIKQNNENLFRSCIETKCKNYNFDIIDKTKTLNIEKLNNNFEYKLNETIFPKNKLIYKIPNKSNKNKYALKKNIHKNIYIKKNLLSELNNEEKNNKNKLQIVNFYFNILVENNIKQNVKKIANYNNRRKKEKIKYNKNIIHKISCNIPNNNIKDDEINLNNYNYIKNEKKIRINDNNKKNINIRKNEINKNIINKYYYNLNNNNYNNNKEIIIDNIEENNSDKLSVQSMSDSKIYEMTNNYMNLDEFIDKNQINNILSTKKFKNI